MDADSNQCVSCFNKRPNPKTLSATDRAWLAGLLEGEGTFLLKDGRPRIRVQMTDEDVVARLADVTGIGTVRVYVPRTDAHKQSWYWTINVRDHNAWVIKQTAHLLGTRRRQALQKLWAQCAEHEAFPSELPLDARDSTAWVAGIVEGEGSIVITRRQDVSLTVEMTDLDIVNRLRAVTKQGKIYRIPSRRTGWSASAAWKVTRINEVAALLSALYPWFGQRRRASADRALACLSEKRGS